jgi:hypothetical protein
MYGEAHRHWKKITHRTHMRYVLKFIQQLLKANPRTSHMKPVYNHCTAIFSTAFANYNKPKLPKHTNPISS